VCLEDGVPLIDIKTIHKTHETFSFKSLSRKETEEARKRMLFFFLTGSLILSVFICLIVMLFSGSPFSVIREQDKISFVRTFLYNAGAVAGIVVSGAVLLVPIGIFLCRRD
jgi:cytochrome bd-type quinol oxidase subunit 2